MSPLPERHKARQPTMLLPLLPLSLLLRLASAGAS